MEQREFEPRPEPTSAELIAACRELVTEEELAGLEEEAEITEFHDLLSYVFTVLEGHVEDPEEYLKSKGILE